MTSRRHFPTGPLLIALTALASLGSGTAGSARAAVTPEPARAGAAAAERALAAAALAAPEGDLTTAASGAGVHPTDGPDADVRIWIEESAVRFRVEANLAFADAVVDVPREMDDQLAEVEHAPLARALFAAYAEHNRVTVDGVELDPVLGEWRVIDALEEFIPLFPLTGARALIRVRMEYEYPLLSPPERVSLVWGLYPVDTVARLGPDGPRIEVSAQLNAGGFDYPLLFTEAEPEYIWHGELPTDDEVFLPVPAPPPPASGAPVDLYALVTAPALVGVGLVLCSRGRRGGGVAVVTVGLLLAGAGLYVRSERAGPRLVTPREALAIFEPLHQNIYRAFRFDEEERIYDALARSVEGDLLERLYDQVYRSLINEEEGGAVSRVEAVRLADAEVRDVGTLDGDRGAFGVEARWQVDGAVIHWGHAHRRTQEYAARYTVAETDAGWRIVGSEILEQRVVAAQPGVEEAVGPTGGPAFVGPANREL